MSKREERVDEGEIALQGEGDGQVHRHHHECLKQKEEKMSRFFRHQVCYQSATSQARLKGGTRRGSR